MSYSVIVLIYVGLQWGQCVCWYYISIKISMGNFISNDNLCSLVYGKQKNWQEKIALNILKSYFLQKWITCCNDLLFSYKYGCIFLLYFEILGLNKKGINDFSYWFSSNGSNPKRVWVRTQLFQLKVVVLSLNSLQIIILSTW